MFRNTAKRQVTQDINTSIGGQAVTTEGMRATIGGLRQTTWLRFGDRQLDDITHFNTSLCANLTNEIKLL